MKKEKKNTMRGTSLAEYLSWLEEPGITERKITARLEKHGLNLDLCEHLAIEFKKWLASQN